MKSLTRFSLIFIVFFLSSITAARSKEMTRFKHPTGVFTLLIPKSWGPGVPFELIPDVITFKPSASSELNVSIAQNINLPSSLPLATATNMFLEETPITAPIRDKGNGWNSIRMDFEGSIDDQTWVWLAKFYGYKTNAIAITFSDTKENIESSRAIFEEIANSIEFIDERE